jgi:hypothetical protein
MLKQTAPIMTASLVKKSINTDKSIAPCKLMHLLDEVFLRGFAICAA